jgi:hypothetical protein
MHNKQKARISIFKTNIYVLFYALEASTSQYVDHCLNLYIEHIQLYFFLGICKNLSVKPQKLKEPCLNNVFWMMETLTNFHIELRDLVHISDSCIVSNLSTHKRRAKANATTKMIL